MRSRRQQDSSGLGLWSTNDSELDFTPLSGLSGKTSRNPFLRRNMNASFSADACQPSREPRPFLKGVEM